VLGFKNAAEALLSLTEEDVQPVYERPTPGPRRLGRLVPFCPGHAAPGTVAGEGGPFTPFDLEVVEAAMADFRAKLSDGDVEDDQDDAGAFCADSDEDSDSEVDVSQEGVDEDFMWRLAEDPSFGPNEARSMVFVESALAMPRTAVCAECEMEGVRFSKSQLAKHPDDRRCEACVQKSMSAVYRPAAHHTLGAVVVVAAQNAPVAAVLRAGALPAWNGVGVSVATCSVCAMQLTKENCSSSQRTKAPSRRRCLKCVGASGTA